MQYNNSNTSSLQEKKSRWIIVSSIEGIPSDGVKGNGSPFTNSLIKALLDNSEECFPISELIVKLRKNNLEHQDTFASTPGIGILKNLHHEGGEFQFKIDEGLISKDLQSQVEENVNSKIMMKVLNELAQMNKRALDNEKKHEELLSIIKEKEKKNLFNSTYLDKNNLINLISQDQTDKYFSEISRHLENIDKEEANSLILLQGNWNSIKTDEIRGIISPEVKTMRENQLRNSLIEITRKLTLIKL